MFNKNTGCYVNDDTRLICEDVRSSDPDVRKSAIEHLKGVIADIGPKLPEQKLIVKQFQKLTIPMILTKIPTPTILTFPSDRRNKAINYVMY